MAAKEWSQQATVILDCGHQLSFQRGHLQKDQRKGELFWCARCQRYRNARGRR